MSVATTVFLVTSLVHPAVVSAAAFNVGSNSLSGSDELIYGHGGTSTGNLLNLINTGGANFTVDNAGNLNLSGTITGGGITGTINAGNVSAGEFGANTGGGNYTFPGNLSFSGAADITAGGALNIGDGSDAIGIQSSGPISFSTGISVVGTATSSTGFAVGVNKIIDGSGNISGNYVPELVTARTTYPTLNDRLNGIVTNYSSVISNAQFVTEDLMDSSVVNTSNTTAYYNSTLGTVQNDHTGWASIPETVYGNHRSMEAHLIHGNKMYSATHGYGVKVLNLDNETYEGDYHTGSTPALPYNYVNSIAYDPVRNDIYTGYYSGSYGLMKIDVDGASVTQYTTSNSDILYNAIGESYGDCLHYYNGKVYLWADNNYMQVFDVVNETFTNYQSAAGLPSNACYNMDGDGNELLISTSNGLYLWNMDTDTLTKRFYSGGPQGLYNYTNTVYDAQQDPNDSDIIWVATYRSFQKVSKTTGYLEFHRTDQELGASNYRWTIGRVGDQIWLGSYYGHYPSGYVVYDLNAEDYFVISDNGKVTGNAEVTSSYHSPPMLYNGNYYFNNYSPANVYKTDLVFETSNTFETNVLITTTNDITTALFNYTGGAGTGNNIDWYLSANNGTNWEGPITPGTLWEFTNVGTQFKARAVMTAGTGTTPVIRAIRAVVYDGATWAGQGSTTVETEVLQARDSSAFGIFGSLDLRLEDLDSRVGTVPTHNHDSTYLKLTGGTLSGGLTVNANINSNNLLPNQNLAYDLGSSSSSWDQAYVRDLFVSDDVAIGTTTASYDLDVNGTSRFTQPVVVATPTGATHATTKAYVDSAVTGASDTDWIISGSDQYSGVVGNVGVGTSTPQSKFHLSDSNTPTIFTIHRSGNNLLANTESSRLQFSQDYSGAKQDWGHINLLTTSNIVRTRLAFSVKSTSGNVLEGMTVYGTDSNGPYVGIGTTVPDAKLHVQDTTDPNILLRNTTGNAANSGSVIFREADTNYGGFVKYDGDANFLQIGTRESGTDYNRITINRANGRVGIGSAAPGYNLDVAGTGRFTSTVAVGTPTASSHATTKSYVDSLIGGGPGTTVGYWTMNGVDIYNSNAGQVGIGTTEPDTNLEIKSADNNQLKLNRDGWVGGEENNIVFEHNGNSNYQVKVGSWVEGAGSMIGLRFFTVDGGTTDQKMIIRGDGDVGIGTDDPKTILELEGGSAAWDESTPGTAVGSLHLDPGSSTDHFGSAITFGASDSGSGDNAQAGIYVRSDGSYGTKMYFATSSNYGVGSANRMMIEHAGDVGIGTTNPFYKLDVNGTGRFANTVIVATPTASTHATTKSYVDGLVGGGIGTGTSHQTLRHNGSSWVASGNLINNGTNVGIGTGSPSYKLHVYSGDLNSFSAGTNSMFLGGWDTTETDIDGLLPGSTFGGIVRGGVSGHMVFALQENDAGDAFSFISGGGNYTTDSTYDTVIMHLTSNGMVGIKDTTPNYTLDVNGTSRFTQPVIVGTPTGSTHATTKGYVDSLIGGGIGGGTSGQTLRHNGTSWIGNSVLYNNGTNIGIGTASPGAKLDVLGGALPLQLVTNDYVVGSAGSRTRIGFGAATGNTYSYIQTTDAGGVSASDLALQQDSGNVGIGTTSPSAKLDVRGGHLYVGSETFSNPGSWNSTINIDGSSHARVLVEERSSGTQTVLWAHTGDNAKVGTISSDDFGVIANGATVATFEVGGNMGVGTTNPAYRLDVNGTSRFTQPVIVATPTAGTHAATKDYVDGALTSGDSDWAGVGGNPTLSGEIYHTGNVGIGTNNPATILDVTSTNGTISFDVGNSISFSRNGFNYISANGGSSGELHFRTGGDNTRLSIDNNGNVGIGTENPTEELDVEGRVSLSNNTIHEAIIWPNVYDQLENRKVRNVVLNADDMLAYAVDRGWTVTSNRGPDSGSLADMFRPTGSAVWNSVSSGNPVEISINMPSSHLDRMIIVPGSRNSMPIDYKVETYDIYPGDWQTRKDVTGETSPYIKFIDLGLQEGVTEIKITVTDAGDGSNDQILNISNLVATSRYQAGRFTGYAMSAEGDTMYGNLIVNGTGSFTQPVTVATPTATGHATTKSYVDGLLGGGVGAGSTGQTLRHNGTSWVANSILYNDGTNIGINTTNPGQRLSVSGGGVSVAGTYSLYLMEGTSTGDALRLYSAGNIAHVARSGAGSLAFDVGGTSNAMNILDNGNVGIGTNNPLNKLHVNGDIIATGGDIFMVYDGAANSNNDYFAYDDSSVLGSGGAFTFYADSARDLGWGAPTAAVVAKGAYFSGDVGIKDSTPSYALDVNGTARFTNTVTVATPTADTHATTKAYVDSAVSGATDTDWTINGNDQYSGVSGNVGIGTTSPDMKFHVDGSAHVDDVFRTGNWRHVLSTGFTSTATNGYLLTTAIPYDGATQRGMHTIRVKGFAYGLNQTIDFVVNFYAYTGGWSTYGWTNYGSYDPGDIKLSYEGGNIKLWWSNVFYYPSYEVFTTSWIGAVDTDSYFEGWTITDAVAPTTNVVNVSYKNANPQGLTMGGNIALNGNWLSGDGGNEGLAVNSSGYVGIADSTPSYNLDVNGTGRFTQPVIVATPTAGTHAATKDYVDGALTSGDSDWAGVGGNPTLAGEVYHTGNVGIGTTNPGAALHVVGTTLINTNTAANPFYVTRSGGTTQTLAITTDDSWVYFKSEQDENSGTRGGFVFEMDDDSTQTPYFDVRLKSGTRLMTIESSGEVGIGTTTPSAKLHILNSSGDADQIISGNADGDGTLKLLETGAGDVGTYLRYDGLNNRFGIFTGNNPPVERLTVLRDQSRVGIGSTAPGYALDVAGTGRFTNTVTVATPTASSHATTKAYVDGLIGGGVGSGTSGQTLRHNGTSWVANSVLYNNGTNIGIGTTNPDFPLDLQGTNTILNIAHNVLNGGDVGIQFSHNTNAGEKKTAIISDAVGSWSRSDLHFILDSAADSNNYAINTDTKMIIKNSGNVGIGTTNPQDKLDVSGAIRITGNSSFVSAAGPRIYRDGSLGLALQGYAGATHNFAIFTPVGQRLIENPAGTNNVILNHSNGNTGISTTSPAYKLDVAGTGRFTSPVIVGTPTGGTHAATKDYVDTAIDTGFIDNNASGENLLRNGDFEDGIENWELNMVSGDISTTDPKSGAQHFARTNTGSWLFSTDYIPIDTDKTYKLEAWVKQPTDGGSLYLGTRCYDKDKNSVSAHPGSYDYWAASGQGIGSSWEHITGYRSGEDATTSNRFAFHPGTAFCKVMFIVNYPDGGGTTYVDDIKLTEVGYGRERIMVGETNDNLNDGAITFASGDGATETVRTLAFNLGGSHPILTSSSDSVLIQDKLGINNSSTSYTLDVSGTGRFTNPVIVATPTADTHATTKAYVDSAVSGAGGLSGSGTTNYIAKWTGAGSVGNSVIYDTGTNIGIGTTSASELLSVGQSSNMPANITLGQWVGMYMGQAGGSWAGVLGHNMKMASDGTIDVAATHASFGYRGIKFDYSAANNGIEFHTYRGSVTGGNAASSERMRIQNDGDVGIGVSNASYKLDVSGTGRFTQPVIVGTPTATTHAATKSYVDGITSGGGAWTGDLNMGGNDITNVNKLTVNTIDPLYSINNTFYSSYAASMVGGVKEEYVGKTFINRYNSDIEEYEYILDFSDVEEESDLWLWRTVTDFSKENVEVFITPYGQLADVYYEIDGDSIIFRSNKKVEISYRLIGKRFDWVKWPTKAEDQSGSSGSLFVK